VSTKKRKAFDPAEAANARVLEGIRQRAEEKENQKAFAADIGLDPKPQPKPEAKTAAEFLADEWDRASFGDPPETYTRVVYGPDPLLRSCPEMKARIEAIGLEAYAHATAEAIRLKGENAVPDPHMRFALGGAIKTFGLESVAAAFVERIMKIPRREVQIETDREDPLILARPLEEAVEKYGNPGMAPKFLSPLCIERFGMRGYVVVTKPNGDPVKVGTLIMAEIPKAMAERRLRHYAEMSNKQVREIESGFNDVAERHIGETSGFATLRTGENVSSSAAGDFADDPELTRSYLGRNREAGFRLDREA